MDTDTTDNRSASPLWHRHRNQAGIGHSEDLWCCEHNPERQTDNNGNREGQGCGQVSVKTEKQPLPDVQVIY